MTKLGLSGGLKLKRKYLLVKLKPILFIVSIASLSSIVCLSSEFSKALLLTRWQLTTNPLPQTLANHTALFHEGEIYVIGGENGINNSVNTVYYIGVNSNGTLDSWNNTSFLPLKIATHGMAFSNSRVYITGGWTGTSFLDTTYCADFLSGGGLTTWTLSPTHLPVKLNLHASVRFNEWLYVIGGWNGNQPQNSVYLTRLQPNGCIGQWQKIVSLPRPLYRHTALVFEGRIYVIGGRTQVGSNKIPVNTVYVGTILPNGSVGQWLPTSSLPHPSYYHSTFISKSERKIYIIGGSSGENDFHNTVYSAYLNTDGMLQTWKRETLLDLPTKLFRHAALLGDNGVPYIIGGRVDQNYQNSVYYLPPLSLTKSGDPPGPVHEGDIITYTISYANTSLATQTMTITDPIPFNVTLKPDTVYPPEKGRLEGSSVVWNLGNIPPGESGHVSFQVQVPLFLSSSQTSLNTLCAPEPTPTPPSPAYILPAAIACDTTRFWANGVTRQPPIPIPHTIHIQIPPGMSPSKMWLLMKGIDNAAPTVGGVPAELETASHSSFGASLWSADITPEMLADRQATVITQHPRELNAVFLFDQADPPFDQTRLEDFISAKTFTYTLDIPSVTTQTIDVLLPIMDVTYLNDDLLPNSHLTTVTVEFDGQDHKIIANNPNLGNGLLMAQFPFKIGHLDENSVTKTLTVEVDTEDSVYILAPRVCRPVYIENTAWLCSLQAGCISATVRNPPGNFSPPNGIYLPIIMKSSS